MATIIEMPKLSDTMTTGTLVKWLVKEGQAVRSGQMLAEVETDKATMEVENFEEGQVLKLFAKEGDSIAIGDPICAVGEAGEAVPDQPNKTVGSMDKATPTRPDANPKVATQPEAPEAAKAPEPEPEAEPEAPAGEVKASPLARKVAAEKGVDLRGVKGTGPGGRIVKDDVLKAEGAPKPAAAKAEGAAKAAPAPVARLADETIAVTNMRAAIARALVASKTEAPHFYLMMEVDGGPLTRLREELNGRLAELPPEKGGIKFSVNDLILKAAAAAVRRVPAINRSWRGKEIVQHGSVHLAFGVAVDDGLLTPVIRDADVKGLRQIALEAKDLIGKARAKKLKPDEMTGSTLTVTNLGMYGISDFYGIINPPNAAILSVGATVKVPIVNERDEIVIGHRLKVGLSGDHRVIDGALGAEYLAALREVIEAPATMLI